MQKIFEKQNCTMVFFALELVEIVIFFLAVGHRTPHTSFKSLLKYMYIWQGGNSELFLLPLKALVSVEELFSVEDVPFGPLREGGEINILTCFWF